MSDAPLTFQVAIDGREPHVPADWWGPHTWVTLADPEGNEFCI